MVCFRNISVNTLHTGDDDDDDDDDNDNNNRPRKCAIKTQVLSVMLGTPCYMNNSNDRIK